MVIWKSKRREKAIHAKKKKEEEKKCCRKIRGMQKLLGVT